jgi:hypothetical protein
MTAQDDQSPTAAGVPVAGAGRADEDAHGGSLAGAAAGSDSGAPEEQPVAGGDQGGEPAQGTGAPDSH